MTPFKILLVDDNEIFARTAKSFVDETFLHEPYYENLVIAGSALEALAHIEVDPPALVLMDLRMPGMDGVAAVRRIKLAPSPPVVVMMSLCEAEVLEEAARAAGADGFVAKSALVDALPGLIQSLIDRTRG